ncbi:uncharacterized protein LOC122851524 [Aphidius gifuensis]|uniref:uncharacterized protein LOC122851524 n=1 Tax=Aphidius gifuensis TaxID=684658 RepID=UPI001CDCE578|nr:uncharacterized protein LOC122851524 [Aphidius gifuensis]
MEHFDEHQLEKTDQQLFIDSFNICCELLKRKGYHLGERETNIFSKLSFNYGHDMYDAMMVIMDKIEKSNGHKVAVRKSKVKSRKIVTEEATCDSSYEDNNEQLNQKQFGKMSISKFQAAVGKKLKKKKGKKSKVTGRISKRVSRKTNNKKSCHECHHDDNDDDDVPNAIDYSMILERVDDYCLANIFMNFPVCERPKFALVCKKWKRALDDSWHNVNKLELTHWHLKKSPNFLKANYPTIDGQFNFLKSLLNKCGGYLRKLDLTTYSHCNIVPVISENCPNLVELRLRIKYIDEAALTNAFIRLSKLQVLKIAFQKFSCDRKYVPVTLIKSLLNVADTLTHLNLSYWAAAESPEEIPELPEEFISVFTELKALKKFRMRGINASLDIIVSFGHCKNVELKFCSNYTRYQEAKEGRKIVEEN